MLACPTTNGEWDGGGGGGGSKGGREEVWQSSKLGPRRRNPTTIGSMQNGSSVGISTRCMHILACLGADLYLQPAIIDKISASELSRKFIKSVLLVGC